MAAFLAQTLLTGPLRDFLENLVFGLDLNDPSDCRRVARRLLEKADQIEINAREIRQETSRIENDIEQLKENIQERDRYLCKSLFRYRNKTLITYA